VVNRCIRESRHSKLDHGRSRDRGRGLDSARRVSSRGCQLSLLTRSLQQRERAMQELSLALKMQVVVKRKFAWHRHDQTVIPLRYITLLQLESHLGMLHARDNLATGSVALVTGTFCGRVILPRRKTIRSECRSSSDIRVNRRRSPFAVDVDEKQPRPLHEHLRIRNTWSRNGPLRSLPGSLSPTRMPRDLDVIGD
jgi:hypothetical protein